MKLEDKILASGTVIAVVIILLIGVLVIKQELFNNNHINQLYKNDQILQDRLNEIEEIKLGEI